MTQQNEDGMDGVHKAFAIWRLLLRNREKWTGVTTVAAQMGMAKSSTHRYLNALVQEGVLEYDEDFKKYRIKQKEQGKG